MSKPKTDEPIIVGVNDREEWNAEVQQLIDDVDFPPLKAFLEMLKE